MAMPGANWVVAIFLLLCLVLVAVYIAKGYRDLATRKVEPESISHLADFEKLRREGKLAEDEYKRLKQTLPRHLGPLSDSSQSSPRSPKP